MRKNKQVNIAITEVQYNAWKKEADKRQISLSEFIRQAMNVYMMALEQKRKS